MGEHGTWFDYLNRFEWWRHFNGWAEHKLGREHPMLLLFQDSGWSLTHVLVELLVVLFTIWGVFAFYRGLKSADRGVVPPRKVNLRNFFEYTAESVYGMVEGSMGEQNAARFFPLIGALWMFILFGNLIGLVPGFISPNDTLKTNLGIALLVFVITHVVGVREHGIPSVPKFVGYTAVTAVLVGGSIAAHSYAGAPVIVIVVGCFFGWVAMAQGVPYLKHFLGPSPALSPLMLPIELISHIARPVSLSVRLMGNMMADHKVVMSFFALVPILVPLPFLLLGLLICLIQALVFCSLAMVYISMAIEHEEH
jgi:F-type H+-transporting ATPase subunit a